MSRVLFAAGFIAALLPCVVPIYFMCRFGTDIPYLDQWHPGVAGVIIKAHQGTLEPSDLWMQQNEHRIVVPRLIFLALDSITGWNTYAEMILVWLTACGSSAGILWLCHKTMAIGSHDAGLSLRTPFLWFLCNLVVFAPSASEDWVWGMGIQFVLPPALLISALVITLSNLRLWLKAGIGMVLCTLATYSAGNGIFCWALIGILLAWSTTLAELKRKAWVLIVWVAAFVLNAGLYLVNFRRDAPPPDSVPSGGLFHKVYYGLVFLGGPFGETFHVEYPTLAAVVGGVLAILFAGAVAYFLYVWIWTRDWDLAHAMLTWLALGGFTILSAMMVAIFRSYLPPLLARASRYGPFEACLPVSLVVLVSMICSDILGRGANLAEPTPQPPSRAFALSVRIPAFCLAAALILVQLRTFEPSIENARSGRLNFAYWKGAVLLSKVIPDNRRLGVFTGLDRSILLREIRDLDAMGCIHPPVIQSSNAAKLKVLPEGSARGSIDDIAQDPSGRLLQLKGWGAFPDSGEPAQAVFITCEDVDRNPIIIAMADPGLNRPDVADHEGNPDLLESGWSATFPSDRLPAELRVIKLDAWALDVDSGDVGKLGKGLTIQRQ